VVLANFTIVRQTPSPRKIDYSNPDADRMTKLNNGALSLPLYVSENAVFVLLAGELAGTAGEKTGGDEKDILRYVECGTKC